MSRKQRRSGGVYKPLTRPTEASSKSEENTPKGEYKVYYVVDVPFKYNGKRLQRGDLFVPSGSKNDKALLNGIGKLVRRVEEAMPVTNKRKR